MEMSLQEKENEIIESFSLYDEWLDKYEYLIDLGKSLEGYPDDKIFIFVKPFIIKRKALDNFIFFFL